METDPDRDVVTVRATGRLVLDDLTSAIAEVWRQPAFRARPIVLWDVRGADVRDLASQDLREALTFERRDRPYRGRARMAFVADSNVVFGMARMVDGMAAGEPIDIRSFRNDEEAAWQWLLDPESSSGIAC